MWTPTHVQVTVQRCTRLIYKGKNGTNDAFVTICLGKEKYQTSVKERSTDPVEWREECELPIPKQGNKAEIVLTVLHRNFIGDEFLGTATIPLSDFDVYEKPRNKWYELKSKPGHEKKDKQRGELEVRIGFTVHSDLAAGSLADINKKDSLRSSFGQLHKKATNFGGSLLSLGKEKKGLKNLVKNVGHKVSTLPGRGKKHGKDKEKEDQFITIPEKGTKHFSNFAHGQKFSSSEADPGVVSDDDEDFKFDELSHKSSHSSLSVSQVAISTSNNESLENLGGGEFLSKNYATPPPVKTSTTKSGLFDGDGKNQWNTGPVDEWEAKLFGKTSSKISTPTRTPQEVSPASNKKVFIDDYKEDLHENVHNTPPSSLNQSKSMPTFDLVKPSTPNSNNNQQHKEPVPKPRQIKQDKVKIPTLVIEDEYRTKITEIDEKPKPKEKEKTKSSSAKETLASIFNPSKNKQDDQANQKNSSGAPIGISSPMRKETQMETSRLPREIYKRFEGKSKDDMIELVINLQQTVDMQRQKITDYEAYVDNLLLRVLENKPSLLQSPFVLNSSKIK